MASAKGRAKGAAAPSKCKGTTQLGKPCRNKPKAGSEYCGRHQPKKVHPLDAVVGESKGQPVTAEQMLLEGVKAGACFADACRAAGIPHRSATRYKSIGEEWVDSDPDLVPKEHRPCWRFWLALQKAEGEAIVSAIAVIKAAARGRNPTIVDGVVVDKGQKPEWMAAAWLAERRNPGEYARPQRIEHTGKGGRDLSDPRDRRIDWAKLTVQQREQLVDLLEQAKPVEEATP